MREKILRDKEMRRRKAAAETKKEVDVSKIVKILLILHIINKIGNRYIGEKNR